jgi:hypothetical protein
MAFNVILVVCVCVRERESVFVPVQAEFECASGEDSGSCGFVHLSIANVSTAVADVCCVGSSDAVLLTSTFVIPSCVLHG